MTILHGDDRIYNNIFIQQPMRAGLVKLKEMLGGTSEWDDFNLDVGTFGFEGYPTEEEFLAQFTGYVGMGTDKNRDIYYRPLPVWVGGNVFFNGAKPTNAEKDAVIETDKPVTVKLVETKKGIKLQTNVYDYLSKVRCQTISTQTLGMAFEPEEYYENPDGTPIIFNEDYFGNRHPVNPLPGPFVSKAAAGTLLAE